MKAFKFALGDQVRDLVSGFTGIVTCQSRWLNNCDTYGVQSQELKDGVPMERQHFDEPQLVLVKASVLESPRQEPTQKTGGPERPVPSPNR